MSLTNNLKTTGRAAQIERADLLDSITTREPRSVADEISTLKLVLNDLRMNALNSPLYAHSLLTKAQEIQSQINALEADTAASEQIHALEKITRDLMVEVLPTKDTDEQEAEQAEIRRVLDWLEDEPDDDNYPTAMGR